MKRIHALLSLLLVALVSGAWVVKDTANPVDIYTGVNTTPTIRGATSGAVTVGPTNFAGVHQFYGDADFTAMGGGGLEFLRTGEPVTGRLFISASADTLVLGTETAHGIDLRTNSTSVLTATSAGAVTAGYLTGGAGTGLSVKGTGSSTMVVDRTSSVGALSGIELQGGGTKNSRLLSDATFAFVVENSSGSGVFDIPQGGGANLEGQLVVDQATDGVISVLSRNSNATVTSASQLFYGYFNGDSDATGAYFAYFRDSNTNPIGSITAASATTVAFNTTSDLRLKKDATPITGALAKVQAMNPVRFKWKEDNHEDEGFIAQELKLVYPLVVSGDENADIEAHPEKTMQVDYGKLTPVAIAAIKELKAELDALAADYAAYKAAHP